MFMEFCGALYGLVKASGLQTEFTTCHKGFIRVLKASSELLLGLVLLYGSVILPSSNIMLPHHNLPKIKAIQDLDSGCSARISFRT